MGRESFHQTQEISTGKDLRDAIKASSKPEFYTMLEKMQDQVTIDNLLQDRVAQARLDVLLNVYSERSERGRNVPMVVLKDEREDGGLGATLTLEHNRFQLNDGKYLYYFSARQPEDAYKFLRNQDIVPVEGYEDWRVEVTEPFKKPINRVPLEGGVAESYSYHSGAWENNEKGIHTGRGMRNKRLKI